MNIEVPRGWENHTLRKDLRQIWNIVEVYRGWEN